MQRVALSVICILLTRASPVARRRRPSFDLVSGVCCGLCAHTVVIPVGGHDRIRRQRLGGRCVDSEETSKLLRATGVLHASALLEGHDREVSKSLVALRRRNAAIQGGRVVMSRPLATASISLGAKLQLTLHSVERQLQRDTVYAAWTIGTNRDIKKRSRSCRLRDGTGVDY
jgi:hypothetical protein